MKLFLRNVLLFVVLHGMCNANSVTFDGYLGKFKLDIPHNWQASSFFLGAPLVVMGKKESGRRPVLVVSETSIDKEDFNPDLNSNESNKEKMKAYLLGRKEWLKRYKGKIKGFIPYKKEVRLDGEVSHTFGYKYQIGNQDFIERSTYFFCKKKLFHLKRLILNEHDKDIEITLNGIVRSFRCID